MTRIIYPHERRLLSVDKETHVATVKQGALEIKDTEGCTYGGFAYSTYQTDDLTSLMTRNERRTIASFLAFKRTYDAAETDEQRREIEIKMMKRFGTMDMQTLQDRLEKQMIDNPRISIRTRRGHIINTSTLEQRKFLAARNAGIASTRDVT